MAQCAKCSSRRAAADCCRSPAYCSACCRQWAAELTAPCPSHGLTGKRRHAAIEPDGGDDAAASFPLQQEEKEEARRSPQAPETAVVSAPPAVRGRSQLGLPSQLAVHVRRPALTERLHHALGACSDSGRCLLSAPSAASHQHHQRCHVAVLHGTAGVGKTHLALRYAAKHEAGSAASGLQWWLAAEQRDTLQLQYHELARQAGVDVDTSCDFPTLVSAVNLWLSSRHHWLLVLDGAQSYEEVRDVVPPTPHRSQHVIISYAAHRVAGCLPQGASGRDGSSGGRGAAEGRG